jgi:hypothetical protein
MPGMNGSFSRKRLFGAIDLTGGLSAGRLVWLLSLGVAVAVLEQSFAAPALGAEHGVLMPLFYLLPGALLDLGYRLRPSSATFALYLPLVSALAWASKPVLRVLANVSMGMQFGSLRAGPVYPVITHLLFGFVGGLAAVLLWRMTERAAER